MLACNHYKHCHTRVHLERLIVKRKLQIFKNRYLFQLFTIGYVYFGDDGNYRFVVCICSHNKLTKIILVVRFQSYAKHQVIVRVKVYDQGLDGIKLMWVYNYILGLEFRVRVQGLVKGRGIKNDRGRMCPLNNHESAIRNDLKHTLLRNTI